MNKSNIKIPQPEEITQKERDDAMGAYLMMFAAAGFGMPLPFLSLIASIIYFYINKKVSDFVAFHAYQSLITQLPISLINAYAIFWFIKLAFTEGATFGSFLIFLLFAIFMNIVYFIFSIVGAIKARKGRFYYFLFFGRIAFTKYYSQKAQERKKERQIANKPPKGF